MAHRQWSTLPYALAMQRYKAVGAILGGVTVVALGATAVFAAPVPAPSAPKAGVTQGQGDEVQHESATEADNNGPNDQGGDQAEPGDKAGAQSTEDTGNTGAADPAEKPGTAGAQGGADGEHEDAPAPVGTAPQK